MSSCQAPPFENLVGGSTPCRKGGGAHYATVLYNLSAYNSLLVCYIKFTCLIPGNVCVQAEGMLKPMKILVLIQRHVKKILSKNQIVILNCQYVLYTRRKLHWNKSMIAKVCLAWSLLLWKITLKQKRDS